MSTIFPLIEDGSQIRAGSLIQSGGQTSFVPIEAGSLIQAGSLIEAGGSKGEYTARLLGLSGISLCSNKYKTKNLCVLNNVMLIGEPGGSNRSPGLLLEEIWYSRQLSR